MELGKEIIFLIDHLSDSMDNEQLNHFFFLVWWNKIEELLHTHCFWTHKEKKTLKAFSMDSLIHLELGTSVRIHSNGFFSCFVLPISFYLVLLNVFKWILHSIYFSWFCNLWLSNWIWRSSLQYGWVHCKTRRGKLNDLVSFSFKAYCNSYFFGHSSTLFYYRSTQKLLIKYYISAKSIAAST